MEMKDSVRTGSQPRVNTTQRHPVNLISFVETQYNLRYRFSRKQMAMTDVFCHILRKIYRKSKMNMCDSKGYMYTHIIHKYAHARTHTSMPRWSFQHFSEAHDDKVEKAHTTVKLNPNLRWREKTMILRVNYCMADSQSFGKNMPQQITRRENNHNTPFYV